MAAMTRSQFVASVARDLADLEEPGSPVSPAHHDVLHEALSSEYGAEPEEEDLRVFDAAWTLTMAGVR